MPYSAKTDWRNNDIVTPDDLNRIEQGIADASAPLNDVSLYVSPSGDDDTGTGEQSKPFRTIRSAIDAFPNNNDMGKTYWLHVEPGSYPGFSLSCFKRIHMLISGSVEITGNIGVKAGDLTIDGLDDGASIVASAGSVRVESGTLTSFIMIGVANNDNMPDADYAFRCSRGGHLVALSDVVVSNYDTAIACSHSHVTLHRLLTEKTVTGILCDCGIVQLGDDVIQATTKFVAQYGGRIYVGSQTNMPNY